MSGPSNSGVETDGAAAVGARIALAREAVQMTTQQLARRLGVETSSLAAWEAGRREPRANRLRMLGGLLGVSLTWLLEGRDDGQLGPTPPTVHALRLRLERARMLMAQSTGLLEEVEASLAEREAAEANPR